MILRKIISGGQTGADRGGLEAARNLGLETGGTAPRGFRTEEGSDESLLEFGLVEDRSFYYPPRTRKNVEDSDGTVLFGYTGSPGSRLTMRLCRSLKRPLLTKPTARDLASFIEKHQIGVLNVAGNRESTNPGIQANTSRIIEAAVTILRRNGE